MKCHNKECKKDITPIHPFEEAITCDSFCLLEYTNQLKDEETYKKLLKAL